MGIKSFFASLISFLIPVLCLGQNPGSYIRSEGGITVRLKDGSLSLFMMADNAVRVRFFKDVQPKDTELVFIKTSLKPDYKVSESSSDIRVEGKKISVYVNKRTGTLSFADNSGKTFLKEKDNARKLIPDTVAGEKCFRAEQSFESPDDEYLFGLGQFQDGHYNLRNITRRLTQVNSQISLPFIFSSEGYGLLWHQYGLTDFNPTGNLISLQKQEKSTGENQSADVTTTTGTQRRSQNQSIYNGTFKVPADGLYSVFADYGDMESRYLISIDEKNCIDQSNMWLPPTVSTLVKLTAGEHKIQVTCKVTNTPVLSWKAVGNQTTFSSPNAKLMDYIVFYGPSADEAIATYRNLSGNVPMLPLWAYGFWQCRERYTSGKNLVETVNEFRRRNLPVDVIVQDWQYWGNNGWGVPKFDETNYPDPSGFIGELHSLHSRFNISIWSNPDIKSDLGKECAAKNLYIPNSNWLDYFNPITREAYWNTLNKNLFIHGVDSWWMDATEPENDALRGKMTYLGPGEFYRLTYPMFVSAAVYEGQRNTTSDKRVCILTRSAFLGQQRYGTVNWSGDIGSTWDAYRRQIVAGLNYNVTGMPFWTTDIGGFFRPGKTQYTDEKYHELLIRWFQWGVFNPIFRIHGYQSETEPWKFGEQVEDNMRKMLDLRYRLLPYIYSEAYQITSNGSTMMRPLVMDFANDKSALDQPYEYMFGKQFLVTPVIEPGLNECDVYLPKNTIWYDFWSGQKFDGGQSIQTKAPMEMIPLFVKAGSVLPLGKMMQYTGQLPADTLEIRVYKGADGKFTLYEDEGDNYNYEKGLFSTIDFIWNDIKGTLTISERKGEFSGMLKSRVLRIVAVSPESGTGMNVPDRFEAQVIYDGKKKRITLR
jgi:alpha-D-xyloside xylohydrolase